MTTFVIHIKAHAWTSRPEVDGGQIKLLDQDGSVIATLPPESALDLFQIKPSTREPRWISK